MIYNKRANLKETSHANKRVVKPTNRKKTVEFKRKVFEFMESEIELKIETFNKTISIPCPGNKDMVLFVDKFSWTPSRALIDATIKIAVSYPNVSAVTIYTSKKVHQMVKGIRNVNLLYSIKAGCVINVSFECLQYDAMYPKYSFEYKWLDPQTGKNPPKPILL